MSEPNPRRRLSLLGGLGAAAILAAACTSGATPSPSTASAPPVSPSAAASSAPSASASAEANGASGETYEVTVATDAKLGKILTGEDGKTLYRFTKDSPGKSACTGGCASAWPPFTLEDDETIKAGDGVTGTVTTITRDDGTKQVAYNNTPLYYYGGDSKAGDTTGQGVGGVWFVAQP